MPKSFSRYVFSFLVFLCLLEGAFYVISFFIPDDMYYLPPTRESFRRYFSTPIDWDVGWRPGSKALSPEGYRRAPAAEGLTRPCVSLYGDSFTFGFEVAPEYAWGNVLTKRLGCRVDNYGVPGYGTDQAYLYFQRHQQQGLDKAPVVILSHLSENIVRNINQDFSLVYESKLALKPRFVTDGSGHLSLVEIPHLSPEDYDNYVSDMGRFLRQEYLLPYKSELSKRRISFPHFITVPYIFTYKRIYASLLFSLFSVPPWFAELYDPAHPSHALQVTRDILLNFERDARRYGRRPLIFVIPTARDMLYFQKTKQWSYSPLLASLRAQDVSEVINLGPPLLAKVNNDDLCDYFCTSRRTESGHYTVKGNRILAEVASEVIMKLGVLSPSRSMGRGFYSTQIAKSGN